MILTLDIGNSNIKLGLFKNSTLQNIELIQKFQLRLNKQKKINYFSKIKKIFLYHHLDIKNIKVVSYSSVVPSVDGAFLKAISKEKIPIFTVQNYSHLLNFITRDNFFKMGSDRIFNIISSLELYPYPGIIIVDFGTATTFNYIHKNQYIGGLILPGVMTSLNALIQKAEKLPHIHFKFANDLFAKDTVSSMTSGIYLSTLYYTQALIKNIRKNEFLKDSKIIFTGFIAKIIQKGIKSKSLKKDIIYDPNLTLKGLYIALKKTMK